MSKYFTIFTILFFTHSIYSQSVFNAELIKKIETNAPGEILNVLVLTADEGSVNFNDLPNTKVHYNAGNIYSISSSISSIKNLSKQKSVKRIEYTQHHLQMMADTMVYRNRVKDIKLGTAPLTQSYDGTGVTVGIIDSGTDFNHPDFKDASGNSRIKFLWDMTLPVAVNTPTPFGYGQEWTNSEIDLGLCTHDDAPHYGHGSASAGIAAGNGLGSGRFEGMAPKADIIVVALDFNRPGFTISDALQYIVTKAQQIGQPFVVNASVGDYYGSHDGTDLETQIIKGMIANIPGRAMVASCGNGGDFAWHVGYDVVPTDTNFTWVYFNNVVDLTEYADTLQIKNVMYSVGVNNPNNLTNLGRIPFKPYNYALNTVMSDTIYNNTNRIGIVESIASINTFGVYELYISIKPDSLGYLWRMEHTGTGRIDSWNFNYIVDGLPTVAEYPDMIHYKMADTLSTIVSGFQCSDEIITVANYANRAEYIDVNNTVQSTGEIAGHIAESSSRGPTRDNRVKPDIAATGASILTCNDMDRIAQFITNSPSVVSQDSLHVPAGGTSASSPAVAGFVALYLQKNPTATNQQIRQAIINCAYSDVFTGATLPNVRFGYGKLDGFAAMSCGTIVTNVNLVNKDSHIKVLPNPLTTETNLVFTNDEPKTIKLYNAAGQLVFSDDCKSSNYTLKRHNLPAGLYLLMSEEKNTVHKVKLLFL